MGYPSALTAPEWGLYDTLFEGKAFTFPQPLHCYVMENILFKVAFPAEFHAQTAVECAITLHPQVHSRIEKIAEIHLETQEAARRIIDKKGPLYNPADRDHCLQYMAAVALLKGALTAEDYSNENAKDPRIDALRCKMTVSENPCYTRHYLDPQKRAISNSMYIRFTDGSQIGPVEIEYPLGHRKRRQEARPLIFEKFAQNVASGYSKERGEQLAKLFQNAEKLLPLSVSDLVDLFPRIIHP